VLKFARSTMSHKSWTEMDAIQGGVDNGVSISYKESILRVTLFNNRNQCKLWLQKNSKSRWEYLGIATDDGVAEKYLVPSVVYHQNTDQVIIFGGYSSIVNFDPNTQSSSTTQILPPIATRTIEPPTKHITSIDGVIYVFAMAMESVTQKYVMSHLSYDISSGTASIMSQSNHAEIRTIVADNHRKKIVCFNTDSVKVFITKTNQWVHPKVTMNTSIYTASISSCARFIIVARTASHRVSYDLIDIIKVTDDDEYEIIKQSVKSPLEGRVNIICRAGTSEEQRVNEISVFGYIRRNELFDKLNIPVYIAKVCAKWSRVDYCDVIGQTKAQYVGKTKHYRIKLYELIK